MAAFKAHGAMTITLEREPSVNAPIQLELWIIHIVRERYIVKRTMKKRKEKPINIPLTVSPSEKKLQK